MRATIAGCLCLLACACASLAPLSVPLQAALAQAEAVQKVADAQEATRKLVEERSKPDPLAVQAIECLNSQPPGPERAKACGYVQRVTP